MFRSEFRADVRKYFYEEGYEPLPEAEIGPESEVAASSDHEDDSGYDNKPITLYPITSSVGIDLNKLNSNSIKLMIGDLVRFQRKAEEKIEAPSMPTASIPTEAPDDPPIDTPPNTEKKPRRKKGEGQRTKISFNFTQEGNIEYTAVPIPVHKSKKAFTDYIKKKDYPEEILHAMGKSIDSLQRPDSNAGAKRMLQRMVKRYKTGFMEVANENGLQVGMFDAVTLAVWQKDTNLKD